VKPFIVLVLAAGVATAGTATTVALRTEQALTVQEPRRAGPDSVRVATLFATLSAGDPIVCEMIADQLGNFWWSDSEAGIGRFADTRRAARLGKDSLSGSVNDPRAIRLLGATLSHEDPCVRFLAAKMLGNSTAEDAVIGSHLESGSARVREAALRAAGERDRLSLRPRAERMLGDDADIAAMAAWALGEFDQKSSVGPLRRALGHASARVRAASAQSLGEIEDLAAVSDLERLAGRDADRSVRLAAIHALGELEARSSAAVLERVLEGNDTRLAIAAAEALQSLDIEGPAPEALVRAVESSDMELRYAALRTLIDYEDERSVSVLLRFVRDPDPDVRSEIIQALGSIGSLEAIPALKRALEDPDPEVRRAAVEALAEIDDR
jgi:HEAT repeat protein